MIEKEYYNNGNIRKIVYKNDRDQLHREDGPGCIMYNIDGSIEREYYYKNDEPHRLDGPSINNYTNGYKAYFIDGIFFTHKLLYVEYVRNLKLKLLV